MNPTKQQTIQQFNKKQASLAAQPTKVLPTPMNTTLAPTKNMSKEDIALLQKVASGQPVSKAEQIKIKALETKENLKQTDEQQKALAKAQQEEAEKNAKLHEKAQLALAKGIQNASTPMEPAVHWMENLPTPGGIGTMLIIIAVFLLAIVPVNATGDTRLKLMWLTLTSKTHLRYTEQPTPGVTESPGNTQAQQSQPVQTASQQQLQTFSMPPGIDLFNLGSMEV